MTISDSFENDLMKLIFQATPIPNVADNALTTTPITTVAVALHTADPGDAGTMATSEVTYTGYARVNVARASSGWTVTANSVSPFANIVFPPGTGGSGVVTHFSVGVPGGGTAKIFFSGTVTPNITTGLDIQPILTTGTTIALD